MIASRKRRRRLVMPPPLTVLVSRAVELGYEIPEIEDGELADENGDVYPAMKATLVGSEHRRIVEAYCRVVNGPEPFDERTRWAARSALAEALRLASGPDAVYDDHDSLQAELAAGRITLAMFEQRSRRLAP